MMQIDKKKYLISENNHYKTQTVKTQIVLSSSLRKDNFYLVHLQNKEYGRTKRWNNFTITRDGKVYQHFDTKYHSDFLSIKEADKKIISIVLENMGALFKVPNGGFINFLNETCSEENVVNRKLLGYEYWEKFYDKQIESTVLLCQQLCEEHSIPNVCIDFHNYHKDSVKFRGIVFKSNYIEESGDINPLFDIQKFNEMLRNRFI